MAGQIGRKAIEPLGQERHQPAPAMDRTACAMNQQRAWPLAIFAHALDVPRAAT
jgi:hypothetical protein